MNKFREVVSKMNLCNKGYEKYNDVAEEFINYAIYYAINKGCTKHNCKKNIRSYIENVFKKDEKYNIEKIIEAAYWRADQVFRD